MRREDGRVSVGEGGGGAAESKGPVGCVCYVCEAPSLPGKFDVRKALELKVPKVSTWYALLYGWVG